MKRTVRFLTVMAVVFAACSGDSGATTTVAAGGDDSSTTTTTTTTTTSAPVDAGAGASSEFCGFVKDYAENIDVSPLGMGSEELEKTFRATADSIDRAADLAPGEIKSDVRLIADGYRGFIDFLAEHDFNFLALTEVDLEDPRLLALDDPALEAAGVRISTFCGMDEFGAEAPDTGGGSGTGGGGGLPTATLPDDFPAALVPPGGQLVAAIDLGATGQSIMFEMESATEETIDFYTEQLGEPTLQIAEPPSSLWSTEYEGVTLNVIVSEGRPGITQVNIVIE